MIDATKKFQCPHCGREFIRESSFVKHMCKQKRRWDSRGERHVIMAFEFWKIWYKRLGMQKQKNTTLEFRNFMESRWYMTFVKVARHVLNTKIINPYQFLDYLMSNNINVDKWTNETVYHEYIHDINKRESVDVVLERFAKLANTWAHENNENWQDYFRNENVNLIIKNIRNGRISPWILLKSNTAHEFFERCSEEQTAIVDEFLNIKVWQYKMHKNPEDARFVESALNELGI